MDPWPFDHSLLLKSPQISSYLSSHLFPLWAPFAIPSIRMFLIIIFPTQHPFQKWLCPLTWLQVPFPGWWAPGLWMAYTSPLWVVDQYLQPSVGFSPGWKARELPMPSCYLGPFSPRPAHPQSPRASFQIPEEPPSLPSSHPCPVLAQNFLLSSLANTTHPSDLRLVFFPLKIYCVKGMSFLGEAFQEPWDEVNSSGNSPFIKSLWA